MCLHENNYKTWNTYFSRNVYLFFYIQHSNKERIVKEKSEIVLQGNYGNESKNMKEEKRNILTKKKDIMGHKISKEKQKNRKKIIRGKYNENTSREITGQELDNAIRSMKMRKATGHDRIISEIEKYLGQLIDLSKESFKYLCCLKYARKKAENNAIAHE